MPGTTTPLSAKPVTVVGAGSVGRLIGLTLATRGSVIRLHDTSPEALAATERFISAELPGLVETLTATGDGYRAGTVETYDDLAAAVAGAGLVIEAVPEDPELKSAVLATLDELADPDAVVASNSSSFPVAMFVAGLKHPERVLNVHFHNPPQAPAVDLPSSGTTKPEILTRLREELPRFGLFPFESAVESLEPYLAAGRLGRKTGEGFFRYDPRGRRLD